MSAHEEEPMNPEKDNAMPPEVGLNGFKDFKKVYAWLKADMLRAQVCVPIGPPSLTQTLSTSSLGHHALHTPWRRPTHTRECLNCNSDHRPCHFER